MHTLTQIMIKEGDQPGDEKEKENSEEFPPKGSYVEVHYTGTLADGTVFDSSRNRNQTFKFNVGVGQVILGWDKGIMSMRKGERCKLVCPPEYAYGKEGHPPIIPRNSTLTFDVELIGWSKGSGSSIPPNIFLFLFCFLYVSWQIYDIYNRYTGNTPKTL